MSGFKRNSILNLIFNYSTIIFNLVVGIVLVPLYLSNISIGAYGSYLAAASISLLIGLLEFGLSMVATQRLARSHAKNDWDSFRETISAGLLAASFLFLLSCIITIITSFVIAEVTKVSKEYSEDLTISFIILGISASANIYLNFFGSIYQALMRAGTLGLIQLISAGVGLMVIVVGFKTDPSLVSIASGVLARSVCATSLLTISSWYSLRDLGLTPRIVSLYAAWQIIAESKGIFLGSISKSLTENFQNLLLINFISPAALTILVLTQKIFQACSMVLAPIGSSIFSNFVQIREIASKDYFSMLLKVFIKFHFQISIMLVSIAVIFNKEFVELWVGEDKFGGVILSAMLGISALISIRYNFFSYVIYSTGDFKTPLKLEVGYSILKFFILVVLINALGLYAVPIAEVVAGLIFFYACPIWIMAPLSGQSRANLFTYLDGWFEYLAILIIGYLFLVSIPTIDTWMALAISIIFFSIFLFIIFIIFNLSFIKKLNEIFKIKS